MRDTIAKATVEELQQGPLWRAVPKHPQNPCYEIPLDEDYLEPLVYRMMGDSMFPCLDLDFRVSCVVGTITRMVRYAPGPSHEIPEGCEVKYTDPMGADILSVTKEFTVEYVDPNYMDILINEINRLAQLCHMSEPG